MKYISVVLLCAAVFVSGCASGPKYAEMKGTIPALSQDKGRLFVYRPSSLGFAVKPDLKLNGQVIGESTALGFLYVDQAPGDYKLSTETEAENELTFKLDANETKYIRTRMKMGLMVGHVVPELVPAEEALQELDDLSFTPMK